MLERPATTTASPMLRDDRPARGRTDEARSHPGPPTTLGLGLLLGLLLGASAASPGSRGEPGAEPSGLGEELGVRVLGALTDSPQLRLLTPATRSPPSGALDDFRRIRINLLPRLQRATGARRLGRLGPLGRLHGLLTSAREGREDHAGDGPRGRLRRGRPAGAGRGRRPAHGALSRRLAPHAESGLSRGPRRTSPDVLNAIVPSRVSTSFPPGAWSPTRVRCSPAVCWRRCSGS